ncbi:MAG TPA: AI-2E family transporter [Thermomicrobiales bacterium]|nr:hypothetical protein [Chloroflexota bacterium]HCG31082.1 hypothetical protein [Chloroflexota bacterium]HQZ91386.1 AI-2E family transporter [Thermomicrobiales bacterium]HRA31416.1 AI-2E family transporter [Thermomicrobiales bacterium]
MSARPPRTVITRIELPRRTIVTIVLVIAVIWLAWQLWQLGVLLIIATLLAAAGDHFVQRLEQRGRPRTQAVGILIAGLIFAVVVLGLLVIPPLIVQGQRLAEGLPDYVDEWGHILDRYPTIQQWLQDNADQAAVKPGDLFGSVLSIGSGIVTGIANIFITLALTAYILLDGPRIFEWAISRLAPALQARSRRVRNEVTRTVGGYVRGQTVVSALFGLFTLVALSLVGVPEPLLLAVMAAVLDAVPQVGATLATIPVVLLALTVSPLTAIIVLALFLGYQAIENYVIVPRVFGVTLQIPAIAILLAVLIGARLLGVVGALLALPIAAAIPAVVRAWPILPPDEEPAGDAVAPAEAN